MMYSVSMTKNSFQKLKDNQCTFDPARTCNRCFSVLG